MAWNPEHTNPPGGLANYYRTNVIGGPGAFVIVAEDFNSFGQAIVKKLIAEIADAGPPSAPSRAAEPPLWRCAAIASATTTARCRREFRQQLQAASRQFRFIPEWRLFGMLLTY